MRIICMIPARLGSKRVEDKVIRPLNGKPLVQYALDSAKKVFPSSDLYLNSSFDELEKIAKKNKIQFYRRDPKLSEDTAVLDDIMYDFFKNIECDIAIHFNLTSPFITEKDLGDFTDYMIKKDLDYLISVKEERIEIVYDGKPLNYDQNKRKVNSQNLKPALIFTAGLCGFKKEVFVKNFENYNAASFGHTGDNIEYYTLKGFSTIDIDWEEDFQLAEVIAQNFKI